MTLLRQLYDRYLHRYFDVIPSAHLQNAPGKIVLSAFSHARHLRLEPGRPSPEPVAWARSPSPPSRSPSAGLAPIALPPLQTLTIFHVTYVPTVDVARHVKQHYEFLVCEPSLSTELCDAKKGCIVCHKFAAK